MSYETNIIFHEILKLQWEFFSQIIILTRVYQCTVYRPCQEKIVGSFSLVKIHGSSATATGIDSTSSSTMLIIKCSGKTQWQNSYTLSLKPIFYKFIRVCCDSCRIVNTIVFVGSLIKETKELLGIRCTVNARKINPLKNYKSFR